MTKQKKKLRHLVLVLSLNSEQFMAVQNKTENLIYYANLVVGQFFCWYKETTKYLDVIKYLKSFRFTEFFF